MAKDVAKARKRFARPVSLLLDKIIMYFDEKIAQADYEEMSNP